MLHFGLDARTYVPPPTFCPSDRTVIRARNASHPPPFLAKPVLSEVEGLGATEGQVKLMCRILFSGGPPTQMIA